MIGGLSMKSVNQVPVRDAEARIFGGPALQQSAGVHSRRFLWSIGIKLSLVIAVATGHALASPPGTIFEFPILYPITLPSGSTHEITYNENDGKVLWVTGQNYDTVVKVALSGDLKLYPLPADSGPHGIAFDAKGQLWLTLEYMGKIVRIDFERQHLGRIRCRPRLRQLP